jgi:hypothetical protein
VALTSEGLLAFVEVIQNGLDAFQVMLRKDLELTDG